ncbi:unnamed protein product [Triticum turgidum subsp. durum]|uniref:Protein kinase domain-containing protein n=1 Tax=Triticum turgidum subsp. durum TaxID=4567 RepID=A0A9R0ZGI5_TRITD|nr:unnamed protein product [Triticum turgidum subsp. durum]
MLPGLTGLYLHYNELGGAIPRELGDLPDLAELYLGVNNLSGGIPIELGRLHRLQVLQLGYNQLSGSIPTQLGELKKLTVLAVQSNQLTGAIPASLGDLPELTRLDLSSNHLFGSIPSKLAGIPQIATLDLRNNTLSGSVPSGLKKLGHGFKFDNNLELCGSHFDTLKACPNDENVDDQMPHKPESTSIKPQQTPQNTSQNRNCDNGACSRSSTLSSGAVLAGTIIIIAGVAACGLSVFSWHRRQKQKVGCSVESLKGRPSLEQSKETYQKSASSLINVEYSSGWDTSSEGSQHGVRLSPEGSPSVRFNLEEVECATQYFSDINVLGKSTFAATHRGIMRDGSVVAVKSINKSSCKSEEADFLKGLRMLTSLRHENLVGLRGFCRSRARGECFLVYEFMANGSLSRYLDIKDGDAETRILDWPTRVSIISGIAKGIEYLHSSKPSKPPLVHQNISADKVLLDHLLVPRLSGSGVHKLLADDVVFSTLKGSAALPFSFSAPVPWIGWFRPDLRVKVTAPLPPPSIYISFWEALQIRSGIKTWLQILVLLLLLQGRTYPFVRTPQVWHPRRTPCRPQAPFSAEEAQRDKAAAGVGAPWRDTTSAGVGSPSTSTPTTPRSSLVVVCSVCRSFGQPAVRCRVEMLQGD